MAPMRAPFFQQVLDAARGALPRRPAAMRFWPRSLSGRLLMLTIVYVMVSGVLVYVPTVASFHRNLLEEKLAAAQLAVLALEETEGNQVSPELRRELLTNAGVRAVSLKRNETRQLFLADDMPNQVDEVFDLRSQLFFASASGALSTLLAAEGRILRIIGFPRFEGGQSIEALADEGPIRAELYAYAQRVLVLSLVISLVTGALVFISLHYVIVRPIRRITHSMTSFRDQPEDEKRIIAPIARHGEIGDAETALADMQTQVRSALRQRAHLAALGTAVAKINHDLRNILSSAQLASDRLAQSDDPAVKRAAPKLVRALDRAIDLATNTLRYGRADELPPQLRPHKLLPIVTEAVAAAGETGAISVKIDVAAEMTVFADGDQLFRVLLNLIRNAAQALSERADASLSIAAEGDLAETRITIADNGPGLPDAVKAHLFEPFAGGARTRGTGLGLAIAHELISGHGGQLQLVRSDAEGTVFQIILRQNGAAA